MANALREDDTLPVGRDGLGVLLVHRGHVPEVVQDGGSERRVPERPRQAEAVSQISLGRRQRADGDVRVAQARQDSHYPRLLTRFLGQLESSFKGLDRLSV